MAPLPELEAEVSFDEDPDRLHRLLELIGFDGLLAGADEKAGTG